MLSNWWIIRIPVLFLIPCIFYDLEIFFLISSFIFLHLIFGLKVILNDYLHSKSVKVFLFLLIRLCNLEILRYFLEFFF